MTTQTLTDTGEMVAIHEMFRRQLGELPDLIRAAADPRHVSDHLRLMLDMLHGHHTAEDVALWPLLAERAPAESAAIVAVMEEQHATVDRLTEQVRTADADWRADPRPDHRDRLAGLVEDLAVTLEVHLDAEERDVLPLAARTLTPAEWGAIGKSNGHKFSPYQTVVLLQMLTEAGDPAVVGRMKKAIPAPVRFVFDRVGPSVYRTHRRRLAGR